MRRPQTIQQTTVPDVADPTMARALASIVEGLNRLQAQGGRSFVTFDLEVGRNAVPHGLGRPPAFVGVTPTVADASFAFAVDSDNPHPDRHVLIDVVGVAQPGASILVM